MPRSRRRPSPAMVVACLALAVSLSGVGYAATVLPKNSVGTPQLKKNAVIAAKVLNGSLLAADFKRASYQPGLPARKGTRETKETKETGEIRAPQGSAGTRSSRALRASLQRS